MGKILEDLPAMRREFHQYPETLWTEFWTTATICEYLEKLGFELTIGKEIIQPDLREMVPEEDIIEKCYQDAIEHGANIKYLEKMKGGLTGVMGILDTGKTGPVFQFEADIDALPIKEAKRKNHNPAKEGWRSKNEGKMHACGHDVHITIGLGLAEYISENKNRLSGKFVLTFTPAEEGGHGAKNFAKLPIMREIDYYFAYHDAVKPLGGLFYAVNIFLRSIETYKVEFSAKTMSEEQDLLKKLVQAKQEGKIKTSADFLTAYAKGYTRIPQRYDNTLKAATTAYHNLQAIPKRMDGQFQITVQSFTQGNYPTFPVTFTLTIRADNNDHTEYLAKRAREIMENAARLYDVDVQIIRDTEWCYPAWEQNDPGLMRLAEETWKEMYGETVSNVPFGEMGTDDDVYMMNEIVKHGGKCLYSIIVSDTNKGQFGELHTRKMNIDEELMTAGVNLTINMIEKLLQTRV